MSCRRDFFKDSGKSIIAAGIISACNMTESSSDTGKNKGSQRLSIERLKKWESMGYGMFIHFGMSTFVINELPDGKAPATEYAPDKLDVGQWVSVARDSGMKYAVLTTKHVAGHCLWPTKHTDYSVKNSTNKTDVLAEFVKACETKGVKPGFYYCSWDNHNRFGSKTPSDGGDWKGINYFPLKQTDNLSPFTTSLYQNFQTAQINEILTDYGPIEEIWIDIPGVLGRGYRTFLYNHISELQPNSLVMMNSGISDGSTYDVDYAWPSDLIAIERNLPPEKGHQKWRNIEGKEYYMPGEICDPVGKEWFFVPGDKPRPEKELLSMYENARKGGVNLLLDVPPDKHGLIPDETVKALSQLRKNAGI